MLHRRRHPPTQALSQHAPVCGDAYSPLLVMFSLGLFLPHHNLSSPFLLSFFPYPYKKKRAKETWGILLTPNSLLLAHINHPLYEVGDFCFFVFFSSSPNQRTDVAESDHVCFSPLLLVLVNIHCGSVALRQASLFFIGSGLWASWAARYNDRYTTEEADSDPINLKQPLLLDPFLSPRSTPHAYKRTHLHALVLTSLKASVLVETCPVKSIV